MREIKDAELLNKYLKQYGIEELFDTKDLPFQLVEYEKGEMLNSSHSPKEYLKFIVKGEWKLFYDSSLGRRTVVGNYDSFVMLGDFEFCTDMYLNNWQQALSVIHSVELPLFNVRRVLQNDNRFLRFLLKNMSEKILMTTPIRDGAMTLEEKVLFYLEYESPEHCIENVNKTAEIFHHSRRQLHRVLKKLMDNGSVVKKDNKYIYCMNDRKIKH